MKSIMYAQVVMLLFIVCVGCVFHKIIFFWEDCFFLGRADFLSVRLTLHLHWAVFPEYCFLIYTLILLLINI